jgi:His/Glu/Gln/Arg/opine family amino acid ABC transporter permease subunit
MSLLLGWENEIAKGVAMTLFVAFISLFFGLLLGMGVALAKMSRNRWLTFFGDGYTTVVRGTPELLIVFFVYFGGGALASSLFSRLTGEDQFIELPALFAGVVALSVIFSGYAAESIRGAMQSLPKGPIEAAYAFGMSVWRCFISIKLPMIWRYALPALGNNWLSLIKSTSLISLIGLEELMRKSHIATSEKGEPFRFFITAAAIYLFLTLINVVILEYMERRSRRGERAAQ